jgi:hypothetical protein
MGLASRKASIASSSNLSARKHSPVSYGKAINTRESRIENCGGRFTTKVRIKV